jgi:hypothetical protein
MELGLQVDKLIFWKVEVMLDIPNQLEVDHKCLFPLYIGGHNHQKINSKKLMLFILIQMELWLMTSMFMECIGMKNSFILTLMTIQKESSKLTLQKLHIGKNQELQADKIHGNIHQTNAHHLMVNFI